MGTSAPSAGASGPRLRRSLGLTALVFYGVGDMLGAGIYALVGKVTALMGSAAWLAFVMSFIAAALTALSYASLGSRYPKAGGAAFVAQRAFGQPFLSYLVGLAVLCSGLTSMAAGANAFAGYFISLAGGPSAIAVMFVYLGLLGLVNLAGMRESAAFNIVCTLVEASGLLFVIAVASSHWGEVNYLQGPVQPGGESARLSPGLVLQGGALAFYAFLGFEDLLNISEEAKNPRRTVPLALLSAMAITAAVYVSVAISAVSVLPPETLGKSSQPLVDVVAKAAPGFPLGAFSIIALFAIANTALINHIMGSRLLFGMARQGLLPRVFARVHGRRGTPHMAILTVTIIAWGLMLAGGLRVLASATSALLLYVFIVVNGALLVLRRREGEPRGFEVPAAIPVAGMVTSGAMLAYADAQALKIAFLLLMAITVLYVAMRPRELTEEALETLD